MEIKLSNAGKNFAGEWIFRNITVGFQGGERTAVLGKNGSGKTTLLKMISGVVMPSEGEVVYTDHQRTVSADSLYSYLSYAAPYHELIEEFTLSEMVSFYARFKPLGKGMTVPELLDKIHLSRDANKKIKACSSGMKQKLRLAMALYTQTPVLLLDEPLTNVDQDGITWFHEEIAAQPSGRIIVICSNYIRPEFEFCSRQLIMEDYRENL